jgi:hypothetical protein
MSQCSETGLKETEALVSPRFIIASSMGPFIVVTSAFNGAILYEIFCI